MDTLTPGGVPADGDRFIEGQGTPEAVWLACPWLCNMPRTSIDALLGDARRLVVVAPHPDDEVLGCGGLMALAGQRGCRVTVVSVSDGEHCYPGHPYWTPARLRSERPRELRRALDALGLHQADIVSLGVPDGGVAAAAEAIRGRLRAYIEPGDLWLVTWGRDGHPDHEACHAAVRQVTTQHACRVLEYPVWGWHWAGPQSPAVVSAHGMRLPLDARTLAHKRQAIDRFATQTGHCLPAVSDPVLPFHVRQRFERPFEVFFS